MAMSTVFFMMFFSMSMGRFSFFSSGTDLIFSGRDIFDKTFDNNSFRILINEDFFSVSFLSSDTSIFISSLLFIPSNQGFSTIRFKCFSIFKIFVKGEKSVVIDSHFKSFIINHSPKSILFSLFIINDLSNGFIFINEI